MIMIVSHCDNFMLLFVLSEVKCEVMWFSDIS